jgi:hypothetical protein
MIEMGRGGEFVELAVFGNLALTVGVPSESRLVGSVETRL